MPSSPPTPASAVRAPIAVAWRCGAVLSALSVLQLAAVARADVTPSPARAVSSGALPGPAASISASARVPPLPLGAPGASALTPPLWPPPGRPSPTHRGAPLAITISGGVSLGAYEAGVVYYLVEFLRKNPGLLDARVFTGASAGSMNALLGVVTLCAKESTTPSRSLLYRTWIDVGFAELFRPRETVADSLFSRKAFDPMVAEVEKAWGTDIMEGCDVLLGVTTTRKKELPATNDDALGLARVEERFNVHITGRGQGKLPLVRSYVDPHFQTRQAMLPTDTTGQVAFSSLRDVLQASSAFPLAFSPKEVRFCLQQPTLQTGLVCTVADTLPVAFIDGGVFDNQPVRLASRLLSAGLGAPRELLRDMPSFDDVTLPEEAQLIHISPDNSTFPAEEGEAPKDADRPSALGTLAEFARTFVGNARSKELLGLFEERPDLRERLSVARVGLPTASAPLGAFFGFFERDFRSFDFTLGMNDGRNLVERTLLAKIKQTPRAVAFPEPTGDVPSDWRPYLCLRAVLAGEAEKACDGDDLESFRILLQVSLDRLFSVCARPDATRLTDNPLCTRGALGGPPPTVPHVIDKSKSGRAFRRDPKESDLVYVLRRLSAYGFHFQDLGLRKNEGDAAIERVRELLGEALVRFSEVQPADGRVAIRLLAVPALNLLAYAPPTNIVYGVIGSPNEVGWSGRKKRPTWLPRSVRANFALQFRGVGTLLSSEKNFVAFSPVAGLEAELPISGATFQARVGLRGGYIVSTSGGKPFGACKNDDAEVGLCSRLTTQALFEVTGYDRLRIHLLGEYLPPVFKGQQSLYSVAPAVGAQLSW